MTKLRRGLKGEPRKEQKKELNRELKREPNRAQRELRGWSKF